MVWVVVIMCWILMFFIGCMLFFLLVCCMWLSGFVVVWLRCSGVSYLMSMFSGIVCMVWVCGWCWWFGRSFRIIGIICVVMCWRIILWCVLCLIWLNYLNCYLFNEFWIGCGLCCVSCWFGFLFGWLLDFMICLCVSWWVIGGCVVMNGCIVVLVILFGLFLFWCYFGFVSICGFVLVGIVLLVVFLLMCC